MPSAIMHRQGHKPCSTRVLCFLQEGRQPGVPATAAAAAATSSQREAMQVRRPEQLQPASSATPASKKEEAASAAVGQPGGGTSADTSAEDNRQPPPELPDTPLGQYAGHLQVKPTWHLPDVMKAYTTGQQDCLCSLGPELVGRRRFNPETHGHLCDWQ